MTHGGKRGVTFAVWAPAADRVSRRRQLQLLGRHETSDAAAWEFGSLGTLHSGFARRRTLQIRHQHCRATEFFKADPYAFYDGSAAGHFVGCLSNRTTNFATAHGLRNEPGEKHFRQPLSIYEVHLRLVAANS